MNVFDGVDTSDLLYRYNSLIVKYVELAKLLAPQLETFGKYRNELQQITVEFVNRGITPDQPDSLVQLINKEIESRNTKEENSNATNTDKK